MVIHWTNGIVSESFKYSNTLIITPTKTYDPNNEFDEEYFEFGLFMSRREYKTIRRRLHNGTISAVKEGMVVCSAPFGYDKYKLKGKGYSLKPNEHAKVVKTIFEMYTNGRNLGEIVEMMNTLDLKPPKGGKIWYKTTIQSILSNITYTGKVRYTDKKTLKKRDENGKIILVKNPTPDLYIVDGLHEPIISEEIFYKAQAIYKSHQLADTRTKDDLELKNPLSTLLKCKICGRTMKRTSTASSTYIRICCKNYDVGSSHLSLVEEKIFESLKILLDNYKLDLKKSNKTSEISNLINNTNQQITQLNDELDKTNSQKNKLYDFLEQGIYDNDTFIERSQILAAKISDIKNKINELKNLKENYETQLERKEKIIPNIEKVIELYPYADVYQKNKLLKSCIEKVEYYKDKGSRKKDDFEITIFPLF